MEQIYALLIGIAVLILGIPIGNILAKATKDELKIGKKFFKVFIILSLTQKALNNSKIIPENIPAK